MKRNIFILLSTWCCLILIVSFITSCEKYKSRTGVAFVNGQHLFYSVEGKGRPIVLIHGNGGSHSDLETTQRQLAQAGYVVYALDSRGQGSNEPIDEYHYKDMANDVKAFLDTNNIKKPVIYGFSDGGIVALLLESMYPKSTTALITSGANITAKDAITKEMENIIFGTHCNIDSMPPLVRMMYNEPNMTHEDLQRIEVPVLVCAGDHDIIRRDHTELIVKSLPNATLYIVPDADHGSYIFHNTIIGDIILDFLSKIKY